MAAGIKTIQPALLNLYGNKKFVFITVIFKILTKVKNTLQKVKYKVLKVKYTLYNKIVYTILYSCTALSIPLIY
jgi:hypothetical protein